MTASLCINACMYVCMCMCACVCLRESMRARVYVYVRMCVYLFETMGDLHIEFACFTVLVCMFVCFLACLLACTVLLGNRIKQLGPSYTLLISNSSFLHIFTFYINFFHLFFLMYIVSNFSLSLSL